MSTFAELSAQIDVVSQQVSAWMEGRRFETQAEADEAQGLRDKLADLKAATEAARDAERLPLIEQAQAVQARYAPRLSALKRADDLVRHAQKAWRARSRRAGP